MKISMGAVGFAVPIVAGMVLALIGHPAVQLPPPSAVASASSATAPVTGFALKSVSVDLPVSDVAFPGGGFSSKHHYAIFLVMTTLKSCKQR